MVKNKKFLIRRQKFMKNEFLCFYFGDRCWRPQNSVGDKYKLLVTVLII